MVARVADAAALAWFGFERDMTDAFALDTPQEQPDRFSQIVALCEAIALLEGEQRREAILALEQDHPDLAGDVESLLAFDDRSSPLDMSTPDPSHSPASIWRLEAEQLTDAPANLPKRIGAFRIIRKISEGGSGVVFQAEQDSPRRPAAVKTLSTAAMTREAISRFRREAQSLALLRHPNVVQVYEAGVAVTETGRTPFIAMELVAGG